MRDLGSRRVRVEDFKGFEVGKLPVDSKFRGVYSKGNKWEGGTAEKSAATLKMRELNKMGILNSCEVLTRPEGGSRPCS